MKIAEPVRLVALALSLFANQVWAADLRMAVSGGGVLVLSVPDGWRSADPAGPARTVSLTPASGASFQVLVSPLVDRDGRWTPTSPELVRHAVEGAARAAGSQAVEKSLPVQDFGSGNVHGHYFSATDRAPKSGEFKYLTQGSMSVNGLPVGFTILSNGNAQEAVGPALRMLAAARRE